MSVYEQIRQREKASQARRRAYVRARACSSCRHNPGVVTGDAFLLSGRMCILGKERVGNMASPLHTKELCSKRMFISPLELARYPIGYHNKLYSTVL